MEWSKIKNIIILILLLVNGFLLILVGGQQRRVLSYEQSALTRAAQVLEQNGISVSTEALNQAAAAELPSMTSSRDLDSEARIAQALLGADTVCTDQGSGLYVHSSGQGTAIFRASGDFNFTLAEGAFTGDDLASHARSLLKTIGLEGELIDQTPQANGITTLTFRQLLNGVPLYSCRLKFEYNASQLRSISGTLFASASLASAEESASTLSVSTALIRFLEGIRDSRDVCSAITGLRPGYQSTQSFGSTVYLTPVWLVSTNISDYYLDGITGELRRVL